jgi:hypothetical protein
MILIREFAVTLQDAFWVTQFGWQVAHKGK